jgi:hypothetical protein
MVEAVGKYIDKFFKLSQCIVRLTDEDLFFLCDNIARRKLIQLEKDGETMINITTLISLLIIFVAYMFVTFAMVPRMRKVIKIWLYILVFIGLIFPEFKQIGNLKLNLETYAIVLTGIEAFEMVFKYIVEEQQRKGKFISKRIKRIYENI